MIERPAPILTIHTCDHCGKSSPSLLRCSKCKSAWYCNRTCQSNAWNGGPGDQKHGGHRKLCRRLRKAAASHAAADVTTMENVPPRSPPQDSPSGSKAHEAWRDLMDHVNSMDCNEAYKQMCLAQDEIKKLQKIAESGGSLETPFLNKVHGVDLDSDSIKGECLSDRSTQALSDQLGPRKDISGNLLPTTFKSSANSKGEISTKEFIAKAYGSWIDRGGICSIEYLANVQSYVITLTCDNKEVIPTEIDHLQLSGAPISPKYNPHYLKNSPYFSANVQKNRPDEDATSILSVVLPGKVNDDFAKNIRISIDELSISLRIQLDSLKSSMADCNNIDTIDNLLGTDNSCFARNVSSKPSDLNYLRCRSCQSFIIDKISTAPPLDNKQNYKIGPNGEENTITGVLPLPSGYWDDIYDYLSCYEGQAAINFDSSSTRAMRRTVLEDEAALVMHRSDLKDGATCALNIAGYGGSPTNNDGDRAITTNATRPWKDKSDKHEFESKSVVCANCYNTLGFVSELEPDTYRLYKHLLDCGEQLLSPHTPFEKYTAGSFVAREMIRYAESEGIYTFIVGISDARNIKKDNSAASPPFMFLRMLSWDSLMGIADGSKKEMRGDSRGLEFQKILKVIFEEVSGDDERSAVTDNPLMWKWGGIDLCCLPSTSQVGRQNSKLGNMTKASSVKLFLSSNEWSELKAALVGGRDCFACSAAAALIMMKLGAAAVSSNNHNASLSFLPIIT